MTTGADLPGRRGGSYGVARPKGSGWIARRYLSGIEEGGYEGWPERVFSTGFIRSYAKYLSEDPGPILAEYERSIGVRAESETAAQLRPGWIERERERGSRRATYTLAAGAVLVAGIIVAWVTLTMERRPLPASRPRSGSAATSLPAAAENAANTPTTRLPSPPPASPVRRRGARDLSETAGAAPRSAPSVAAVGRRPLTVRSAFPRSDDQTWLMYSFDDGDPIDVTLYAGKISIQAGSGSP
jgi:cytoskeletal protein RodZ